MLIDELATCCCVRYWTLWIQERQNCIAITAPPIIHPSVPNTSVGRIRVAFERQIVNGGDRSAQHQDTMDLRAGEQQRLCRSI
jgi:hypothetical protein